MANTKTLAQLRTSIRSRCDMENSEFISDAELLDYINGSYAELYDILVSRFEDYYTTTASATISSGSTSFSVPADFYKLRGLDRQIGSSSDYYDVPKFTFNERNWRNNQVTRLRHGQLNVNYRLINNNIEVLPANQAAGTYRIWYVPTYTALASDSDTVDGVNGWEEYIIVDACIKCLEKEEGNTATFARQKKELLKRIEEMASMRDINQPETVTDVDSGYDFEIDWI